MYLFSDVLVKEKALPLRTFMKLFVEFIVSLKDTPGSAELGRWSFSTKAFINGRKCFINYFGYFRLDSRMPKF